jgi:hypothetical protein
MNAGIQRSPRARSGKFRAAICALPLLWSTAQAVTVQVPADIYLFDDPTSSFVYEFSDLNGTALAGQSISIDFDFAQPFSVRGLRPNDHQEAPPLFITVTLVLNSPLTFDGLPLPPSGFLFDENGSLPPLILTSGMQQFRDGDAFFLQAFLNFGPEDLIDEITVPGLHFDLDLSNALGATQIVGAVLSVANPTPIAEPGTLMLFGVGLLGLGLTRRRSANQASHSINE